MHVCLMRAEIVKSHGSAVALAAKVRRYSPLECILQLVIGVTFVRTESDWFVQEWVGRYEENRAAATAELLTLVVQVGTQFPHKASQRAA